MAASGSSSGPSPGTIARMAVGIIFGRYPVLRRFVNDPRGTILGFILGWVVSRILDIGEAVIDGILDVGVVFGEAFATLFRAYAAPVGLAGDAAGAVIGSVTTANTTVAQSFGPLAPAALVLLVGIELFLAAVVFDFVMRAGVIGVLGGIPVVGILFTSVGNAYFELRSNIVELREVIEG